MYGARMYDPQIGRFSGLDPLAADFASWSPYNYVMGGPLLFVDPTGRSAVYVDGVKQDLTDHQNRQLGRNLRNYNEIAQDASVRAKTNQKIEQFVAKMIARHGMMQAEVDYNKRTPIPRGAEYDPKSGLKNTALEMNYNYPPHKMELDAATIGDYRNSAGPVTGETFPAIGGKVDISDTGLWIRSHENENRLVPQDIAMYEHWELNPQAIAGGGQAGQDFGKQQGFYITSGSSTRGVPTIYLTFNTHLDRDNYYYHHFSQGYLKAWSQLRKGYE